MGKRELVATIEVYTDGEIDINPAKEAKEVDPKDFGKLIANRPIKKASLQTANIAFFKVNPTCVIINGRVICKG